MWVICTCPIHTNHPRQTGEQVGTVILVYPPYFGGGGGVEWRPKHFTMTNNKNRKRRKKLYNLSFPIVRHGNWSEWKTLRSRPGGPGACSPQKMFPSKDQNLCNLRLSWGNFYGNKVNFFVCTTTNWNHLNDDQVKASKTCNSCMHSPLVASKLR